MDSDFVPGTPPYKQRSGPYHSVPNDEQRDAIDNNASDSSDDEAEDRALSILKPIRDNYGSQG
jgi:hypothetical protein